MPTHILGPLRQPSLLIPLPLQLRPEERAQVVRIERLLLSARLSVRCGVLLRVLCAREDHPPVEVDDLIVQPLAGLETDDVRVRDLLPATFRYDTPLAEERVDLGVLFWG